MSTRTKQKRKHLKLKGKDYARKRMVEGEAYAKMRAAQKREAPPVMTAENQLTNHQRHLMRQRDRQWRRLSDEENQKAFDEQDSRSTD